MSTFFDQLDRERKLQAERLVTNPATTDSDIEHLRRTVNAIDNFLSGQSDNNTSEPVYYGGRINDSRPSEIVVTGNFITGGAIENTGTVRGQTVIDTNLSVIPRTYPWFAQQLAPLRTEVNPEENLQTIPSINIGLRDWESLVRPRENITNNPTITYSDDESEQDIPPLADENGGILPSSFTFRDNPVIPAVALLHTGQVMEITGNDTIWPRPMFTQSVRSTQSSALLSKLAPLTDEQVAEEESSLACVTCYVNKKIIALNCGHLKTCATCTGEIIKTGGKCPVCREKIVSVMRIYD